MRLRFGLWGLDLREYVASDKGLRRPTDLAVSRGNLAEAIERLDWVAKHKIADIEARKDLWSQLGSSELGVWCIVIWNVSGLISD